MKDLARFAVYSIVALGIAKILQLLFPVLMLGTAYFLGMIILMSILVITYRRSVSARDQDSS